MARKLSKSSGRGFTLVELLVVIAIIGILIALLLPAVQKIRESANRTRCQNNMKQITLGAMSYENAFKSLPPGGMTTSENTSVATYRSGSRSGLVFVLPYIEQNHIFQMFNFGLYTPPPAAPTEYYHWNNAINKNAYQQTVPTFLCPSVPSASRLYSDGAGVTDYTANNGIDYPAAVAQGGLVSVTYKSESARGALATPLGKTDRPRIKQIRDGTSNTLMFAERAGAPDVYQLGKATGATLSDGRWAQGDNNFNTEGSSPLTGGEEKRDCSINCTNRNEMFSFHFGGTYAGFADGSVRFLNQDMPIKHAFALITRAGEETDVPLLTWN